MLKNKHIAFNDGIADIYDIENTAEDGDNPQDGLIFKRSVRFAARVLGNTQYFAALQERVRLERQILVLFMDDISVQNAVVINDIKYQVYRVTHKYDSTPPTTLLALSLIESEYRIKGDVHAENNGV